DWQNIKLYFMVGLPTETQKDLEGIINMAEMALKKGKEITGRRVNINVGISPFVPKPHTPFQWCGQTPFNELRARLDFIRKGLRKKGLNFKGQHIELSLLEAVFSRGGSDCASLLETAWGLGCRFDGWAESFDFSKWLLASEKTGINLYDYAARTLDINSELPWDFIDIGITKKILEAEYEKSLRGEITPDCRSKCYGCGLNCKIRQQNTDSADSRTQTAESPPSPLWKRGLLKQKTTKSIKIRVRFSKTGLLRYLSHREVITALLRAMRRASIPLIYSEGFHPHPKISFGPPLPVGVEGINEYFDIELPAPISADIMYKINAFLPYGLKVLSASVINENTKSLNDFISRYEYEIIVDKTMHKSINSFLELPSCMIKRGEDAVDIRPIVEGAKINNGTLHLILADTNIAKARLYEILKEMFQKPAEELQVMPIKRFFLYGYNDKKGWLDPLEEAANDQ
ncbi:MAG: TIGR03936 family radical SAM-associated protein, partial [Nitrospirota bacterium]